MFDEITREELINLVGKIVECEGTEEEIDENVRSCRKKCPTSRSK
ncbi:hypothetical protein ACSLGG_30070 (plasmid) [Bacillus mycoides]